MSGTIGFIHKFRVVSTAYIWMVCMSKGASNFSSYTFSLVIVDYAHESGVLGQRAALMPALFSLGCLVATLMTGPAVDRSYISKYSVMMLSCVILDLRPNRLERVEVLPGARHVRIPWGRRTRCALLPCFPFSSPTAAR
ncbi:hypothetical protein MRX96_003148 [Rhipicephalus microplus]